MLRRLAPVPLLPVLPLFLSLSFSLALAHPSTSAPLFTWDPAALSALRDHLSPPQGVSHLPPSTSTALHHLHRHANHHLHQARHAPLILHKLSWLPPNASRHHFISLVPYAWPCNDLPPNCHGYPHAETPAPCHNVSGLPWRICDGQLNYNMYKHLPDRQNLETISHRILRLSLAAYLFRSPAYAASAARLLDLWFVDPRTRMLPTLRFAQGVPGLYSGKASGCLDMSFFGRGVVDAVLLLRRTPEASTHWTSFLDSAFTAWCADLAREMLESPIFNREAHMRNNHGLFYDLTILSLTALSPRHQSWLKVRTMLNPDCVGWEFCVAGRLRDQVDATGAPVHELARPNLAHYVWYSLLAHAQLFVAARNRGLRLVANTSALRRHADWAIAREGEFVHMGNKVEEWLVYAPQALRIVARVTGDGRYERVACHALRELVRVGKDKDGRDIVWGDKFVGMGVWNLVFPSQVGGEDGECDVWRKGTFAVLGEKWEELELVWPWLVPAVYVACAVVLVIVMRHMLPKRTGESFKRARRLGTKKVMKRNA